MRIVELFNNSTVGTTGSTTGNPSSVQQVSQTPSTTAPDQTNKPDPQLQQLTALLKQNKVIDNDADMNDFIGAYTASTSDKTLSPDQQDAISKLAGPLMKDPTLSTKLKMLSTVKPGQPAQQGQPMGQVPQGIK